MKNKKILRRKEEEEEDINKIGGQKQNLNRNSEIQ